jgi:biotin operon repressor
MNHRTEDGEQQGWIRLHRRILDSKLWSCSDATFRVAIYLLLSANHQERYVRRVVVLRGQTVRSLSQIADGCGVSRKAVRYALDVLKQDGFLEIDEPFGAQQGHRITICKYDSYQPNESARGIEGSNEGSNEGNTNKNDKKEKNERTTTICAEPPCNSTPEETILTFDCTGTPKQWHLTKPMVEEFKVTFDTIDVEDQSRRAWQWLRVNPTKRKTAGGMPKFLNSWFNRAADNNWKNTSIKEPKVV